MREPEWKTFVRAVTVLLTLGAASVSSPAALPPFSLLRGVVVDGSRGVAYVSASTGGIEAIDLATGGVVWRSAAASVPLALRGNILVAQVEERPAAPRLRLAFIDVAKPARSVGESVTKLPDEVRALVADDVGRTFRAAARAEGDGVTVSWTYRETRIEGVARDPSEAPPERTLSGAIFVRVPGTRPAARRNDRAARRCLPGIGERLKEAENLPHVPWRAGHVLAIAAGGQGEALTLKRWDACTAQPLPARTVSPKALTALVSADERHLLVSERAGSGGRDDPEYRWLIVSLETAEVAATVRRDVSAAPFFVWRDRVVFQSQPHGFRKGEEWIDVPLELVAIRIANDRPVWARAIRDLEYRGTMPPMP